MARGQFVLAIDGGGTNTRAALFDLEGRLLGQGAAGPSHPATRPLRAAKEALSAAATQARKEAGVRPAQIVFVQASIAGAGDHGEFAPGLHRHLHKSFARAEVAVESDLRACLWGGLEHPPGVVVLAGTGSAAYAEDEEGLHFRVGGWGSDFGDEGSAYALARMGLQAASKSLDGRGRPTILVETFLEALDCSDFKALARKVRSGLISRRSDFADLGRLVCRAAFDGDEVARELLKRTACDLVELAAAAGRRLRGPAAPVTFAGSLFRAGALLLDPLRAELAFKAPDLTVQAPHFPPVFGAYFIAMQALQIEITPNLRSRLMQSRQAIRIYESPAAFSEQLF